MFDALLGRKFTAKCKHAIKCIYERLKPIRNRKQSVVKILKKDITDLLCNGNAESAFGRMDGLIIEMNRLACYDMIEKFCECVLTELPVLQKTRECPPEDMEAVSTLIFAAARFSDLPELCDLRQVFTTRYESAMEASVNPEFKDKSAAKTFSVGKKLQLLKDIAREFSVNWDSKAFEYRVTNPTVSKRDQPKKGDSLQNHKALPTSEKDGAFRHMVTKTKDVHVLSHEPELTRKTRPWADEPENMTPLPTDYSHPHAKPEKDKYANCTEDWQRKNDTYRVSTRAREVLDPINQGGKVVEQVKSKDNSRDRNQGPPDTWELNDTDAEYQNDGATIYKRPSRARVMLNPNGEEHDVMEQLRSKDEGRVRHGVPPLARQESNGTDAKESHDIIYKRSSRAKMSYEAEKKQAVGQQEFEENDKPTKAPQYTKPKDMNDVIGSNAQDKDVRRERSGKPRQEADLAAQGRHVVEPQKLNNNRAFHMIPPPYVKPAVSKVGPNSEHVKPSVQPTTAGAFSASDKSSCQPAHAGVLASSDKSDNGTYKDLSKDELVPDDERPKPRSVRRKQQKPQVVQEVNSVFHGDEPVPRIPHGQRRHSSRQDTSALQDNYDGEEKFMDKLLMHYCKKGEPDQSSKHRTRARAPPADHTSHDSEAWLYETNGRHRTHKPETSQAAHPDHTMNNGETRRQQSYGRHRIPKAEAVQVLPTDHVVQDGEAMPHQAYSRYRVHRPESVHRPERAVSLTPDPVTPKEMVRGPARAASMHPDSPSTPGGRMHPQLSDYDALAARFAALKKG